MGGDGDTDGPSQDAGREKNAGPQLCTDCGGPLSQEFIGAGFTDHGGGCAS